VEGAGRMYEKGQNEGEIKEVWQEKYEKIVV
jgi:hypothetical protein